MLVAAWNAGYSIPRLTRLTAVGNAGTNTTAVALIQCWNVQVVLLVSTAVLENKNAVQI